MHYLGDNTPVVSNFAVKNSGTTTPIKAVEIARPNASWSLSACAAPTGWTATQQPTQCLFQSDDDTTALAPGASLAGFRVTTTTAPGDTDVDADWIVVVSSERTPTNASRLNAVPSSADALKGRIRTFKISRVDVATTAVTPGAACPAPNRSARPGTTRTLVICGGNFGTTAHTPTSLSTLGGTFVDTPGTFAAAPAAPGAQGRVLAIWTDTLITSTPGSNLTVEAYIASDASHTSPLRTFGGFVASAAANAVPVASSQSAAVDEDTPTPITLTAVDADDDNLTFSIVAAPTHGTLGVIGAPDCSAVNTCTAAVTYTPTADRVGEDAFTFKVNDGAADSATAAVSITVNAVNDPPVGAADQYDTLGNTRLYVGTAGTGPHIALPGTVLANDTDVDTPQANLTITPATTSSANCSACNNVTVAADGTFVYDPPPGFLGADTFSYTVNDHDTGDAPSPEQSSSGTVTVTVQGPAVWYVDSTPGALTGNTGRSHSPFTSISSLAPSDGSVDDAGEVVFVYSGTYSAASGMPLQTNQKLWGEPHGLKIDPAGSLGMQPLVPAGGTNPVLSATDSNAAGITLASGVDVQRVNAQNSSCSGCDGVRGVSVATATIGPDTVISGNAGRGLTLTGAGAGNIPVGAAISGNTGNAVNVQNRSGGLVSFTAPIATTAAQGGVNLVGNTGARIAFSGGLDLSTTTGSAFNATGGGTVTATQPNAVNKLKSTTGTALNVQNTTIGSSGLKFVSIAANGAANGIALNSTGSLGGLTVGGTGGACTSAADCTGGAIQNTTGAAIQLTSTHSPSFRRMFIGGADGSGVQGAGVTNFTFTGGVITNVGDAAMESALAFNGLGNALSGAVLIINNTISAPFDSGIDIRSDAGTIDNAKISNNTISDPGQTGINIVGTGTTSTAFALTKAVISHNSISSAGFDGIQVVVGNANNTGPGGRAGTYNDPTNKVAITSNSITLDANAAQAIAVATASNNGGARTQMNFDISNNGTSGAPITGSTGGTVILLGNNGFSDMSGKVSNNVIDANHDANSSASNGIGGGNGVVVGTGPFTPQLLLNVTGNTITDTDGNGILLVTRAGSGHADLAVTNNNVAAPLGGVRPGIRVDAGNNSSTDDSVCLDITGNTTAGSGGTNGIGLRKQGTTSNVNDFAIVGLSPSPSSAANTATFVSSQNPSGSGTLILSGDNFVSCPAFTAP